MRLYFLENDAVWLKLFTRQKRRDCWSRDHQTRLQIGFNAKSSTDIVSGSDHTEPGAKRDGVGLTRSEEVSNEYSESYRTEPTARTDDQLTDQLITAVRLYELFAVAPDQLRSSSSPNRVFRNRGMKWELFCHILVFYSILFQNSRLQQS